jgi:PAS domain S-box-containing protein
MSAATSPLARAVWFIGVGATYLATARLGLALDPVGGFAALVWPPTGVALAALVRRGVSLWPAISAGAFLANLWAGAPWEVAIVIAIGNTLEAVVGAHLLRSVPGYNGAIRRVRDAFGLVAAALLSPVVSATGGTLSLALGNVVSTARMGGVWQAWWLGDVLGVLVVAPFLLNWSAHALRAHTRARAAEATCLTLITLASAALCFSADPTDPLQRPHMVFPALVWAAIRFGPSAAALSVLVVSGIGIGLTVVGDGPFVASTLHENLTALQGFMGTAALTSLFLAAANAERSDAERKLAEEHARLHAIAETTSDSIFVKDLEGRYMFVNPAYGRVLGSKPEAVLGKRDGDLFGQDVARQLRQSDRLAVRTDQGSVCEEVILVNGKSRTFLTAKAPYRVGGKLAGSVGIARDITERKNDERRLEEAVHARDEFLSIAGHELRTPLAALTLQVTGLQRTLQREEVAGERTQHELERVDRAVGQVKRLARLVDDLLDVSRTATGHFELQRETFDLTVVVHGVASGLRDLAARAESDVKVAATAPVTGKWDRLRIERLLTSLMTNALKYGAGKPVEVTVEGSESTAVLRVRDRGIGIAPEDVERIFDRFAQVAVGHHRKSLGVGLYIARQIVSAHGGVIRVETAPGLGSTFVVELPR